MSDVASSLSGGRGAVAPAPGRAPSGVAQPGRGKRPDDEQPDPKDFVLYAKLTNELRRRNGLEPMPWVLAVDDPRPFNRAMQAMLDEPAP